MLDGWSAVPNTQDNNLVMKYNTGSEDVELSIFMKRAYAGRAVEIPRLPATTFSCVTPIGRKITYNDRSVVVSVKGTLVDIRKAAKGEEVYPQNHDYVFGDDLPESVLQKPYATEPRNFRVRFPARSCSPRTANRSARRDGPPRAKVSRREG